MINGYLVVIPENQDTELRQFVEKIFGGLKLVSIFTVEFFYLLTVKFNKKWQQRKKQLRKL